MTNGNGKAGDAPRGWKRVKGVRGVVYRLSELRRRSAFAARGAADYLRLSAARAPERPAVTAVVVGRNDDYMPDFARRLEITIRWNHQHLADEVIFVEWNPPEGRELLATALARKLPYLRGYVVSPEIHASICENPRVPLLEFHAKNVGIRRARTDWVVATNADAAFGLDTVRALLSSPLTEEVVWTTERFDIPWREGRERPLGLLDCLRYRRPVPYDPLGTGEFAFASRRMWERVRGYDESLTRYRIGADRRGVAQMIEFGAKTRRAGTVLHLTHPTSCTEGVRPHHGEWATLEGLPYCNGEDWGLWGREETEIAERVWLIR